jgi:type VI protein secretion system component Hcp
MALEAFMHVDGIEGECTASGHEKWIELTEFTYEIGDDSGAAAGFDSDEDLDEDSMLERIQRPQHPPKAPARFKSVAIAKGIDRASPLLFKRAALNQRDSGKDPSKAKIAQIVIHLCRHAHGADSKSGRAYVNYAKFAFWDCLIESITLQTKEDGLPGERVTFSYEKVTFRYIETARDTGQRVATPINFGWDLLKNMEFVKEPTK